MKSTLLESVSSPVLSTLSFLTMESDPVRFLKTDVGKIGRSGAFPARASKLCLLGKWDRRRKNPPESSSVSSSSDECVVARALGGGRDLAGSIALGDFAGNIVLAGFRSGLDFLRTDKSAKPPSSSTLRLIPDAMVRPVPYCLLVLSCSHRRQECYPTSSNFSTAYFCPGVRVSNISSSGLVSIMSRSRSICRERYLNTKMPTG
jgi:hypothetical protein